MTELLVIAMVVVNVAGQGSGVKKVNVKKNIDYKHANMSIHFKHVFQIRKKNRLCIDLIRIG